MWISKVKEWHTSHSELTKYFVEKIKQKVDATEIISNKHLTTNGLTLISEIVEVSKLTLVRVKSVNRLISLIKESQSELKSSIKNDFILNTYQPDIVNYYMQINLSRLNDNKFISDIHKQSKIHLIRLIEEYPQNINQALREIDFKSDKFLKNADKIDAIVECMIPYLIYSGYSTSSISDIAYRYIFKRQIGNIGIIFFKHFSGIENECEFLIVCNKECEVYDHIIDFMNNVENAGLVEVKHSDLREFIGTTRIDVKATQKLVKFTVNTIDPQNYIRGIYDKCLKTFVTTKDRNTLTPFNYFFNNIYWRFKRKIKNKTHYFEDVNILLDPINVFKRNSTLFDTLEKVSKDYHFKIDKSYPYIESINDSVYFYNLAIGSKSIENSLSLLWTSLESLLPYRLKESDIECIQHFVSNSLCIGSIGRELISFITRFIETNSLNENVLNNIEGVISKYINYSTLGIKHWAYWLCNDFDTKLKDPYDELKNVSNILCKQFCILNSNYNGKNHYLAGDWLKKIINSKIAITYQLDRIYLHRNQIVHSGKLINDYSNLWSHLEWYVGKLLSYAFIRYYLSDEKVKFNKEMIYMELEAESNSIINFLNINKEKKISDISINFDNIFKHSWQFF